MNDPPPHPCHHLAPFQMHKWRPDPNLTSDENYMDMVLLLTRNSTCKQGHMACAIVKKAPETGAASEAEMYNAIQAVGVNGSVFKPMDSDNHAEIATIGVAAKHGRALQFGTAYITMPPCKTCFGALVACGISRIVTLRPTVDAPILKAANELNIAMDTVNAQQCQERVMRHVLEDPVAIQAKRQARKERKRKDKQQKAETTSCKVGKFDT